MDSVLEYATTETLSASDGAVLCQIVTEGPSVHFSHEQAGHRSERHRPFLDLLIQQRRKNLTQVKLPRSLPSSVVCCKIRRWGAAFGRDGTFGDLTVSEAVQRAS